MSAVQLFQELFFPLVKVKEIDETIKIFGNGEVSVFQGSEPPAEARQIGMATIALVENVGNVHADGLYARRQLKRLLDDRCRGMTECGDQFFC